MNGGVICQLPMVAGGTTGSLQGVMNRAGSVVPDLGHNCGGFLQSEIGMNCDAVHQLEIVVGGAIDLLQGVMNREGIIVPSLSHN